MYIDLFRCQNNHKIKAGASQNCSPSHSELFQKHEILLPVCVYRSVKALSLPQQSKWNTAWLKFPLKYSEAEVNVLSLRNPLKFYLIIINNPTFCSVTSYVMASASRMDISMKSSDLIRKEQLDYGGFGEVYLCYHKTLGQVVLKKVYTGPPRNE